MKKMLLTGLLFTLTCLPALAQNPAATPTFKPLTVREVTDAQMFRYGRELYRKGDFAQATKVFKQILKINCSNKLAQYHLQKIAQKGAAFQEAADALKNLPCAQYNFSEEDFLPADLYYEKDADLILEQLSLYNARYRSAKAEITGQIAQYKNMINQLETKTTHLSAALNSAEKNASQAAELKKQLADSQALSARLKTEATQLKSDLAASRAAYEKETKALEAKVNAAGTSAANEQTRQALANKKLEMSEKAQELMSLEEKFAALQVRLQEIETALTGKNQEIQSIGKNLSTIEK